MRLKLHITVLLILFGGCALWAQDSQEELLKKGNNFFKHEQYSKASPYFLQLLSLAPKNPNYNYKYGTCLLFKSKEKSKAFRYLKYAVQHGKEVDPAAYYFLGKAEHLTFQFDEAIKNYNIYKKKVGARASNKFDVDHQIQMCKNGKSLMEHISNIIVLKKSTIDEDNFFRIYNLKNIGGNIIVTKEFQTKADEKHNHVPLIYFSANPHRIYYSSYGDNNDNKDIYVRTRLPNGKWSKAQRVFGEVNTPYDEDYPFMDQSGNYLYFSSKGHNSIGGYDIFRSRYDAEKNTFEAPENMGISISSPSDDILYIVDSLHHNAYFASQRESAAGKMDVYHVRVERIPLQMVILKGKFTSLINPEKKELSIVVYDNSGTKMGKFKTDEKGGYLINLPKGGHYQFVMKAGNMGEIHKSFVDIPYLKEFRPLKQSIIEKEKGDQTVLVIKNQFDERFSNADEIIAKAMELKSRLNVNKEQFDLDSLNHIREQRQIFKKVGLENLSLREIKHQILTQNGDLTARKENTDTLLKKLNNQLTTTKNKIQQGIARIDSLNEKADQATDSTTAKRNTLLSAIEVSKTQSLLVDAEATQALIDKLTTENKANTSDLSASKQLVTAISKAQPDDTKAYANAIAKHQDFVKNKLGKAINTSILFENQATVNQQVDTLATLKEKATQLTNQKNDLVESINADKAKMDDLSKRKKEALGLEISKKENQLSDVSSLLSYTEKQIKKKSIYKNQQQVLQSIGNRETPVASNNKKAVVTFGKLKTQLASSSQKNADLMAKNHLDASLSPEKALNELTANQSNNNSTTETPKENDIAQNENTSTQKQDVENQPAETNDKSKTETPKENDIAQNENSSTQKQDVENQPTETNDNSKTETPKENDIAQNENSSTQKQDVENQSVETNDKSNTETPKENDVAQNENTSTQKQDVENQPAETNDKSKTETPKENDVSQNENTSTQKQDVENQPTETNDKSKTETPKENDVAQNENTSTRKQDVENQSAEMNDKSKTETPKENDVAQNENTSTQKQDVENQSAETNDKSKTETPKENDIAQNENTSTQKQDVENKPAETNDKSKTETPKENNIAQNENTSTQPIAQRQEERINEVIAKDKESKAQLNDLKAQQAKLTSNSLPSKGMQRKKEKLQAKIDQIENKVLTQVIQQNQSEIDKTGLSTSSKESDLATLSNQQKKVINKHLLEEAENEKSSTKKKELLSKIYKNQEEIKHNITHKKQEKEVKKLVEQQQTQNNYENIQLTQIFTTTPALKEKLNAINVQLLTVQDQLNKIDEQMISAKKKKVIALKSSRTQLVTLKNQLTNKKGNLEQQLNKIHQQEKKDANKGAPEAAIHQPISYKQEVKLAQTDTYKNLLSKNNQLNGKQFELKVKKEKLVAAKQELQTLTDAKKVNQPFSEKQQQQFDQTIKNIDDLQGEIKDLRNEVKQAQSAISASLSKDEVHRPQLENMLVRGVLPVKKVAKIETIPVGLTISSSKENSYSDKNPIPLKKESVKGLVFRVQIGAFRHPVPNNTFKEFYPISGDKVRPGLIRYVVGYFNNRDNAKTARNKIRKLGYSDAFVVAYCDGERIPVYRALELMRSGACVPQISTPSNPIVQTKQSINEQIQAKKPITKYDYNKKPGAAKADVGELKLGLYYTVQIGVYNTPVSEKQLFNISPLITLRTSNGQIRYSSGIFNSIQAAKPKQKEAIKRGITDAYITAYYKGKRIPLSKARQLLDTHGESVLELKNPTPLPSQQAIEEDTASTQLEENVPYLKGAKLTVQYVSKKQFSAYPFQVLNRYNENGTLFYFDTISKTIKSYILTNESKFTPAFNDEVTKIQLYKNCYPVLQKDATDKAEAISHATKDELQLNVHIPAKELSSSILQTINAAPFNKEMTTSKNGIHVVFTALTSPSKVALMHELQAIFIHSGIEDVKFTQVETP